MKEKRGEPVSRCGADGSLGLSAGLQIHDFIMIGIRVLVNLSVFPGMSRASTGRSLTEERIKLARVLSQVSRCQQTVSAVSDQ